MNEVLVINRARFTEIDMDRMSAIRAKAMTALAKVPGVISMTLWERHDDPFAFLTLGHFATEADSLQAWDALMRSPVIEVVNDLMSETPNATRFFVRWQSGLVIDDAQVGTFMSMSTRIADMGYSPELLLELQGIFEELKMIPGFLGGLTGQMIEIPDEVLGMALWGSISAYEASIPKKAMYKIDLYQRVL